MDAAIHMERVKELMIGAADQPGEQLLIHRRHTHHEVLLGEQSVKPVSLDNVGRDREPEQDESKGRLFTISSLLWIRPAVYLSGVQAGILNVLRTGSKARDHCK